MKTKKIKALIIITLILFAAFVYAAPRTILGELGLSRDGNTIIGLGLSLGDADNRFADMCLDRVVAVAGISDGGLTNYGLKVGDTITPSYGMMQIGNASFGRTSFNVADVDLDGAVIFRNLGGPETGLIEFLWEEGSGATRFAIPTSGTGNATYNPRSMLVAGPAPADTDMVTVGYWQTNNDIFHNLLCDTAGFGADLGVQNDLEVEGDIFADSIKESTSGAGITIESPRASLSVYANNAAAIVGGLSAGAFYRTGGDPDQVSVVH